jgi:hypothetical protein
MMHSIADRDESLHIEDRFHGIVVVIERNECSVSSPPITVRSPGNEALDHLGPD